jgi:hypothetical protein
MKLRQTGRRMKMTSTCRTRAAARAMAADGTQRPRKGESQDKRTESDAKSRTGGGEVILQVIIQKAKDRDEEVEEDPGGEKEALAALIDHPAVPFLPKCFGLVRSDGHRGGGGIESLETLKAATLRLVALQVRWLRGISIVFHVRVVRRELRSVGKVETILRHYELMKQVQ